MVRVAVDTNILVSAAVFRGPERSLVDAGVRGRFKPLIPRRVLAETYVVLRRDFPAAPSAPSALDLMVGVAQIIEDEAASVELERALAMIRDEDDAPILAALLADPPDYFVTGDKDFLALDGQLGFPVLRTRAMLALLGEE